MGSQTTKGFPYPVGTDRVMDGDNAIQALAEKVDTAVGVFASGQVSLAAPGSVDTTTSAAVTFPVGRFTAAPDVVATVVSTGPSSFHPPNVGGVTASGMTVYGARKAGAGSPIVTAWLARQL